MLPHIDYLAMSLLKGEKESVTQLANQLDRFSSAVEGKTLKGLEEARARSLSKLLENEAQIGRLTVRFAELKILERDRTSPYQRYHDIRDYDCIHPNDQIPLNSDQTIVESLTKWRQKLGEVQPHLPELIKVFGDQGTDPKTVTDSYSSLQALIRVFRETAQLISDKRGLLDLVREITKEEALSSADRKCLADWSAWLGKTKATILSSLGLLQTLETEPVSLEKTLHLARSLGPRTVQNILQEAERASENASRMLENWPPSQDLPTRPTEEQLASAQEAINNLYARSDSWFSWQLSPSSHTSRKTLRTLGLGNVTYREGKTSLERLNKWVRIWNLRKTLISCLQKLREMGLPVVEVSENSTAAFISKNANVGLAFSRLLSALACSPQGPTSRVHREIIERCICGLETDAQAVLVLESLQESENHLARLDTFARVTEAPLFESLTELPKRYLTRMLKSLEISENVYNEVSRWETLLLLADPYGQILTLEATTLNTLQQTVRAVRRGLMLGNKVGWLDYPERAVTAHRLSAFIREDLVKNPDDIHDIASRIKAAHKTKQAIVEDAIQRARLVSLKKAEQDNATRFQIVRLRQLLRKKTKTPGLVQLRDQIEYQRLLQVFPCWIMSIEDVARIFPLKPGLFDYLIVDEASQCNQATTLHLAYRAKRMVVVGDRQQLKNANVRFLSDSLVRMLLSKHGLDKHPRADFLHGRESLLALSEAGANTTSFLNEHFRCEPPIITWSNENFYAGRLRILTPIRPRRFVPVAEVRLVSGADDDPELKVNRIEAHAVIAEVKRLIDSGEAEDLDIGIISPYEAQATLLNNLLHEVFSSTPQVLHEHRLIASTADGFQGDERDIILYAFRFGPSSSPGVIRAIEIERERLNVAFSRARRKVISFISRPPDAFPSGLIRSFIEHSIEIERQSQSRLSSETTDKFDSEFERKVCEALRNRGLTVLTQVPCAGFFIDQVALDQDGRRLAIECDGEFHYDDEGDLRPEDYQRQDIIERSGWAVYRVSTRRFYANPSAAIESVLLELKAQPPESDLVGADMSVNLEEQDEISIQEEVANGGLNSVPHISPPHAETTTYPTGLAERQLEIPVLQIALGDGPINAPANWMKLNRWGYSSRQLNRYITWYCSDIEKRLKNGEKLSEQKARRAREIWDMSHKLGFDENQF